MNADERTTKNKDEHRNLVRVLHNALQESDRCAGYALEAEAAGNDRFAVFFREVQMTHVNVAEWAERILDVREDGARSADVRLNANPAQGDPGDVSPGQDVASPAKVPLDLPPRSAPR
jgi:hypothetical protein